MQYNRIILVGRLTRDPEPKSTASGVPVTTFSIAVDRPQSAEARQSGQQKETDFIDIVTWRQQAEYAANYLTKGRLVLVEGRLQIRSYQGQDGQQRKATEVVADAVRSMERRPDGEGGGGYEEDGGGYSQAPAQSRGGYSQGGNGGGYDRQAAQPQQARGGYSNPQGQQGGNRGGRAAAKPQNDDFGQDFEDPFANE